VLKFQKKPEDFDPSASHLYDELGSDSRQRNNYTPLQFPYETRIEKKFEVFHPNPSASNEDAENDDTESVRMLKELPVIDFEDVGTRFQSTLPQATSPDVNDEPSINASMEDDSKKDNSRIDGTESEHILREIPVHDFGDGGKSSFQSTLPQATSPDTNDELLIGASAEYEVESEGSSCIESVFSYADSTVSAITSGSTFESSNSFVQDLAALLWENMALRALCTEAIQHRDISLLRLQRNLHRLLKHFAAELKLEALSLVQRRAASFVAHNSRAVSEDIRKRTEMMNSRLSEQDESSCKGEIKNIQGEDQSDDEASVDEDPGEQARDHEEYSMSAAQQFIISSHALGNLLQDFQKFVHPTFASRLGSLVEGIGKVVTDSEKTRWATVSSILANEFQDCPPLQLRIHRVPSQTFSDRVKIYVEDWTGQLWNWWPASPAHRKPPLHWTRILWNCVRISPFDLTY
jgi:hypothetical protein